jgi:hypothetical protein
MARAQKSPRYATSEILFYISIIHFEGINIPEPGPINDQRARILLPADHSRHYVVNKNPTIPHRVYNSLGRQFPEGFIPMFFHRCLADYS